MPNKPEELKEEVKEKNKSELSNKKQDENKWLKITVWVSIGIAIIALIGVIAQIGLFGWQEFSKHQEEINYQKSLAKNIVNEIDFNLYTIRNFNENKEQMIGSDAIFILRFETTLLEEALKNSDFGNYEVPFTFSNNITYNVTLKARLMDDYSALDSSNRLLDMMGNAKVVGTSVLTYSDYVETKNKQIEKILEAMEFLKNRLEGTREIIENKYSLNITDVYSLPPFNQNPCV